MKNSSKAQKTLALLFTFLVVFVFAHSNLFSLKSLYFTDNYEAVTTSRSFDKGSYKPSKVIKNPFGKDVYVEGTGALNIGSFISRDGRTTALSGGKGPFFNGGYKLVRDYAVTKGGDGKFVTGHGGSYWKLYNREGHRLGTFTFEGMHLRN